MNYEIKNLWVGLLTLLLGALLVGIGATSENPVTQALCGISALGVGIVLPLWLV